MVRRILLTTLFIFLALDFYSQVTIGSSIAPNEGSLLDLKEFTTNNAQSNGKNTSTKGLNLPRVTLESASSLAPTATDTPENKTSHTGLLVYNIGSKSLLDGIYFWNGQTWVKVTDRAANPTSVYYQTETVIGGSAAGSYFSEMKSLRFSADGKVNNPTPIKLEEMGSFAFNVRLYSEFVNSAGTPTSPSQPGIVVMYVGIWVNSVVQDVVEVFASFYPPMTDTRPKGTNVANVILRCTGNAGDVVDIRFGYLANQLDPQYRMSSRGAVSQTLSSNRTSLSYWKL